MTWRRLPWLSSRVFFRTMMFQPLAKAPSMNAWGRGSVSRNSILCGSTHDDLADRGEQRRAGNDHALGRPRDAIEGGLDVLGGEVGAVVELHALAEVERVLLAVGRDLPLPGQVRDDRLAIARIAAEERVVHRALRTDVGDGARLVDVEVGGRIEHAVAQRPAALDARGLP